MVHILYVSPLSRNHRVKHRVTVYLFWHPWTALALPIPCQLVPSCLLLLALLLPASITSLCRQGTIGSPFIYFDVLGPLSHSPLSLFPLSYPVPPSGSLSRLLSFPSLPGLYRTLLPWDHRFGVHGWFSLTRSLSLSPSRLPSSPVTILAFIDGSRALPPSLTLPMCLLPSRAPSSALPLALLLSRSPPPSPSSLSLFPASIAVHLPTNKGT